MDSKALKENNRIVRLCYKYLNEFTDIYPKDGQGENLHYENKMPDNIKLTVFCEVNRDEGFLVNKTTSELGIEALVARKWIIHSELEKLTKCKLS